MGEEGNVVGGNLLKFSKEVGGQCAGKVYSSQEGGRGEV